MPPLWYPLLINFGHPTSPSSSFPQAILEILRLDHCSLLIVENFENYLLGSSFFSNVVDCGSVISLKMISSTGIFWTFIIRSVEQLCKKPILQNASRWNASRWNASLAFIIVVAYINSRNLIADVRDNAFMTSVQKGSGRVLEICCVFADSVVSKKRSLVHFCGWWRWRGWSKNESFFVNAINGWTLICLV